MSKDTSLEFMSVGQMLDYSIELHKKNFKIITILALIFQAPVSFLFSYLNIKLYENFFEFSSSYMYYVNPNADAGAEVFNMLIYLSVIMIVTFIISLYNSTVKNIMDAAVIDVVHSNIDNKPVSAFKALVKKGAGKILPIFGYKLIFGIAVSALVYIGYIVILLLITLFTFTLFSSTVTFFKVISVIIFILVILAIVFFAGIIGTKLSFGDVSIAYENKGVGASLERSVKLTKKYAIKSMITLVMGYLLLYMFPQIISAGVLAVFNSNVIAASIIGTALQVVLSIFMPFYMILRTVLYINMKIKHESYDLELRFDKLISPAAAEAVNE